MELTQVSYEQMNWFIYTQVSSIQLIKKKTLSFVTAWMNLEGIMWSEISHTQKDKYYMILLLCEI